MNLLEFCMNCSENAKRLSDKKLKKMKSSVDEMFIDSSYALLKDDLKKVFNEDELGLIKIMAISINDEIWRREMLKGLKGSSLKETMELLRDLHLENKKKSQEK